MTLATSESGRHFSPDDVRVAQDLATRAAMATETAQSYQQLQSANRLKDEFLATLSHELRTPLNAVLGYARMLQSGAIAEEKVPQALEVIDRNAGALAQIVEDVLDVSRIVLGKARLKVEPTDIAAVVEDAIATVTPAADAKGLRVKRLIGAWSCDGVWRSQPFAAGRLESPVQRREVHAAWRHVSISGSRRMTRTSRSPSPTRASDFASHFGHTCSSASARRKAGRHACTAGWGSGSPSPAISWKCTEARLTRPVRARARGRRSASCCRSVACLRRRPDNRRGRSARAIPFAAAPGASLQIPASAPHCATRTIPNRRVRPEGAARCTSRRDRCCAPVYAVQDRARSLCRASRRNSAPCRQSACKSL